MPSTRKAKEPEDGDRELREDVSSDGTENPENTFLANPIGYTTGN